MLTSEPRSTGYLMRQAYQEGKFVRQGQLLFQIDPRPFQAALDQAAGQLAQAKASLANAKAVQRRTQLDVERYTPLAKEQAVSQQDLDNSVQNNLAAMATVETAEAQIKTAEAAVGNRTHQPRFHPPHRAYRRHRWVRRNFKSVPWSVQSSGAVTTVSTVDPIKVYFTVSEASIWSGTGDFPRWKVEKPNSRALRLQLILANGSVYRHDGTFYFADRRVDVGTGAIRIAGLFPIPEIFCGQAAMERCVLHAPTRRAPCSSARGDRTPRQLPSCRCGER